MVRVRLAQVASHPAGGILLSCRRHSCVGIRQAPPEDVYSGRLSDPSIDDRSACHPEDLESLCNLQVYPDGHGYIDLALDGCRHGRIVDSGPLNSGMTFLDRPHATSDHTPDLHGTHHSIKTYIVSYGTLHNDYKYIYIIHRHTTFCIMNSKCALCLFLLGALLCFAFAKGMTVHLHASCCIVDT